MSLKGFALICSLGAFGFRTVSYFHCLCRAVLFSTEVMLSMNFGIAIAMLKPSVQPYFQLFL